MSEEPGRTTSRALDLRRVFDQTFAEPVQTTEEDALDLLGIRVGGEAYALRLAEITGLFVGKKVVPLSSPRKEFLGLAGLRGDVVPVYSLGGLLGYAVAADAPRWLVVARAGPSLGLAFDQFDGYLRVPPTRLLPFRGEARRPHVREAVQAAETLRGVIGIRSIVEALEKWTRVDGPIKEH